jgi:MurNAc alpha-1-phosphate uridylyltransferase
MKALILAAGLGTRLKELTVDKPKALVEVEGKPLIAYVLEKLVQDGFTEIVVNVHHFANHIVDYLSINDFGVKIHISDETNQLLETGGAILHAREFLDGDEPFLVHNVDILSNIDFRQLMANHNSNKCLATLAVGDRISSRKFLFNEQMQLKGWRNSLIGKEIIVDESNLNLSEFAFAGIHVVNPEFFNLVHTKGPFSIVDAYLSLCSKHKIMGFNTTQNFVLDIGKIPNLLQAKEYLMQISKA